MAKGFISSDGSHFVFICPGCGFGHALWIKQPEGMGDKKYPIWSFNGDLNRPTFSPSLLVRGVKNAENDPTPRHCHSYIRDGKIEFQGDCTHELAGKTVELADTEAKETP